MRMSTMLPWIRRTALLLLAACAVFQRKELQ